MSAPNALILDAWSPLSHKAVVGDGTTRADQPSGLIKSWVPQDQRRRLAAYLVLDAYRKNCARHFLRTTGLDPDEAILVKGKHREYGDTALIGGRIAHGVLGDDWELVVDGADDDLGEGPDLPPEPEKPGAGAHPIEQTIYEARFARWEEDLQAVADEWLEAFTSQPALQRRQDELREWADHAGLAAKLVEGEDDCVHLGDTVYALWPVQNDWPELRRYEPDAYFPVLGDDPEGFPEKLHMAWELEETDDKGVVTKWVRRLTWELVDLVVGEGEDPGARPMPWHEDGDEPATKTCVFSDGIWSLEAVGPNGIPDLSESAARWAEDENGPLDRRDLLVDFIPVIHIPNTPASRTHFGQSALAVVAQILDDIGQSDTDLMEVGRLVAGPVVAFSGAEVPDDISIAPLASFGLGENGSMDVLDLSIGLEKMMAFGDRLGDRLHTNSHVSKSLTGKVDSSEAPSGIALLVDAAPFAQIVGTSRMTRDPKLKLKLRQAQKLAMVYGAIEPGPIPKARVAFGSYLPMDRGQVVTDVTALFAAKLISRRTAIAFLMAAGFDIEDANAEAEAIEAQDFEGAALLADALGSEAPAAEYLGLEAPAQPEAPQIDLPTNEPPVEEE